MDIRVKTPEAIYEKFGNEKVITEIKNEDYEYNYSSDFYFSIPLVFVVLSLVESIFYFGKNPIVDIATATIIIIGICFAVYFYLNSKKKLYFENNKIILENSFKNATIIDVDKFPRIYMQAEYVESTDDNLFISYLFIEQNDKLIKLDLDFFGPDETKQLLRAFEVKEKDEVSEKVWNMSSNEKRVKFEKLYEEYKDGKIIKEVKNKNKNFELRRKSVAKYMLLLVVGILTMFLGFNIISYDLPILTFIITIIGGGLIILAFILNQRSRIKIVFDKDGRIYVDNNVFDPEAMEMKIKLLEPFEPEKNNDYSYSFEFVDENKSYITTLKNIAFNDVKDFLDNFEYTKTFTKKKKTDTNKKEEKQKEEKTVNKKENTKKDTTKKDNKKNSSTDSEDKKENKDKEIKEKKENKENKTDK